jgi:hypothetical protein
VATPSPTISRIASSRSSTRPAPPPKPLPRPCTGHSVAQRLMGLMLI